MKEERMPIKGQIKALKEAPARAIQIAVVALLIAIAALMVSLGKKNG